MNSEKDYYLYNFIQVFKRDKLFKGWGRKQTGLLALYFQKFFNGELKLLEDGFIRSINLQKDNSPSFSLVEDDIGIYYDCTRKSRLEEILNNYDFSSNKELLIKAKKAIDLIIENNISKYNHAEDISSEYFKKDEKRVLVIAQMHNDSSLKYGMIKKYTLEDMINCALEENKDSTVYIKIHPDDKDLNYRELEFSRLDKRCKVLVEDINSISLLKKFTKVYTRTSQMGFEAVLLGCECICFGMPFYAGWGITTDKVTIDRRTRILSVEEVFAASYILYTKYFNPYTQKKSDIFDTINTIVRYKYQERKKNKDVFLFGFSKWKHGFIRHFLKEYEKEKIHFINPLKETHLSLAVNKGLGENSDIFIWGRKEFLEIENFAEENKINIIRVEDGFIRSVSLGSDLTQPFSQVFDDKGIYFDATKESRLEYLLNSYDFDLNKELLEESKTLQKKILETKISKYNTSEHKNLNLPKEKIKILVSGQVEDDASIKFGANGMTNLELLKEVKKENTEAYIIFKPHPDVLSGNRVGHIEGSEALRYCDKVLIDVSMSSVLEAVDEVHTMTSLTGFEGLLYGKKVVTYGLPFYAGWGLTIDKKNCNRRMRNLTLDELCVVTLLLYPRYINPKSFNYCSPLVLIDELIKEKKKIENSILYNYKVKIYTYLSRYIQKFLRMVK